MSLNAPLMAGHIIFYGPVSVPHVAVRAVVLINSVKRMHRQFGKRSEQWLSINITNEAHNAVPGCCDREERVYYRSLTYTRLYYLLKRARAESRTRSSYKMFPHAYS